MTERWVEIPVRKEVRDLIKEAKKELSYNEFFQKVLQNRGMLRIN